jgi:hypothetical protein
VLCLRAAAAAVLLRLLVLLLLQYVYTTQQGQEYFVKLAMGGRDDSMFQGEAQGLQAMYCE